MRAAVSKVLLMSYVNVLKVLLTKYWYDLNFFYEIFGYDS